MKPYPLRKNRFRLIALLVLVIAVVLLATCSFQWHIFEHVETTYSIATLIGSKDAPKLYDASWSLDSNTLIAASEDSAHGSNLYTIDLPTNQLQKITSTKTGFYRNPVWSPTGEYIMTWTNALNPEGIWVIKRKSLESFFISKGQFASWSRKDEIAVADIVSNDTGTMATVTIIPRAIAFQVLRMASK